MGTQSTTKSQTGVSDLDEQLGRKQHFNCANFPFGFDARTSQEKKLLFFLRLANRFEESSDFCIDFGCNSIEHGVMSVFF